MGGIHALEHATIGCSRSLLSATATTWAASASRSTRRWARPAVFIYDGYPGGIGLSERCYGVLRGFLNRTVEMVDCLRLRDRLPGVHPVAQVRQRQRAAGQGSRGAHHANPAGQAGGKKTDRAAGRSEGPEAAPLPEPIPLRSKEKQPRVLVFDLETKRSAAEVGGWGNTHLMGMALGVIWDSADEQYYTYQESEAEQLIKKLKTGDLVVGFNHSRFNYAVLSAYTTFDFASLPNFDILSDVYARLGTRLSLGHLAQKTLGQPKSADWTKSLKWVKEGRFNLVEEYCRKDVELTRDLFYFGIRKKRLLFENKGELLKLQVDWEVEKIIQKLKGGKR